MIFLILLQQLESGSLEPPAPERDQENPPEPDLLIKTLLTSGYNTTRGPPM